MLLMKYVVSRFVQFSCFSYFSYLFLWFKGKVTNLGVFNSPTLTVTRVIFLSRTITGFHAASTTWDDDFVEDLWPYKDNLAYWIRITKLWKDTGTPGFLIYTSVFNEHLTCILLDVICQIMSCSRISRRKRPVCPHTKFSPTLVPPRIHTALPALNIAGGWFLECSRSLFGYLDLLQAIFEQTTGFPETRVHQVRF